MSVAAECFCSRGYRLGRESRSTPQCPKPVHSKEATHPLWGPGPTYPKSPKTEDDDDDIDDVGQEHEGIDISGRSVLGVQYVIEETPQGLVKALGPVDGQPSEGISQGLPSCPNTPTNPSQATHSDRQKLFSRRPTAFILSRTFNLSRV